jgi:beta-lactamase class A
MLGVMLNKTILKAVLLSIVMFSIGALATWIYLTNQHVQSPVQIRLSSNSNYKLIDPVLYTEVPENLSYPAYTPLKNALTTYTNADVSKGKLSDFSVYYRDLNSSQWVGLNTNEKFSPASMLKVATLVAAYHVSESFSPFLSGQVHIVDSGNQSNDAQDFYPPGNPIVPGQTYSIQDLISHMIIDSDNNADVALNAYVGSGAIRQTLNDLKVPEPASNTDDSDTSQEYSHLFRVLFNASYLTQNDSEQALELLSKTTFTQGLVAGVPSGTTVAHKFGERTINYTASATSTTATSVVHELHDCGIVYYPGHPYFLCVMTKGGDFPTLANTIADISKIVWTNVQKLYPN